MGGEFQFHLVDWNTICSSFKNGGFGIRKAGTFNQALLVK